MIFSAVFLCLTADVTFNFITDYADYADFTDYIQNSFIMTT